MLIFGQRRSTFEIGVFAGWQLKSLSPVYITSLLWKPVVYQSRARVVDEATTMIVNSSKNHVVLDPQIDRGIFNSLYLNPDVTAFNVSLGRSDEGSLSKFISTIFFFVRTIKTIVFTLLRFLRQNKVCLHTTDGRP